MYQYKSTMFYSSSLTVLFSVLSLWVKSMQPIHPSITPLSPDHLAASNRSIIISVIGPTQDVSSSHTVLLADWLAAWLKPLYFGPWQPDAACCKPHPHPFPTDGSKGLPGCPRACSSVGGWVRYEWCTPLLHPASCMLVNHGPSQQSSKKEYKPWKWGATENHGP